MLQGELYDVLTRARDAVEVRLHPESALYAAHFPGYPITPGVVLVRMAVELLSEQQGRPLDVKAAKNIKFVSPVIPDGDDPRLLFQFNDNSVSVLRDGVLCATMTMTLEEV